MITDVTSLIPAVFELFWGLGFLINQWLSLLMCPLFKGLLLDSCHQCTKLAQESSTSEIIQHPGRTFADETGLTGRSRARRWLAEPLFQEFLGPNLGTQRVNGPRMNGLLFYQFKKNN